MANLDQDVQLELALSPLADSTAAFNVDIFAPRDGTYRDLVQLTPQQVSMTSLISGVYGVLPQLVIPYRYQTHDI